MSTDAPPPKRARYVLQACNQCKRRKVKCDGNNPCQRCTSQGVACSYYRRARDGRYVDVSAQDGVYAEMRRMQRVLDDLSQRVTTPTPAGAIHHPQPQPLEHTEDAQPHFDSSDAGDYGLKSSPVSLSCHGPTSTEYTLDVVRGSLEAMGYGSAAQKGRSPDIHSIDMPSRRDCDSRLSPTLRRLLHDPLWDTSKDEAIQLIYAFSSVMGSMYPVVDCQKLVREYEVMYSATNQLKHHQSCDPAIANFLLSYDPTVLKLVLAIALTMKTKSVNSLAEKLYDTSELNSMILSSASLQIVVCLVLAALLHFYLDDETKAGRYLCVAVRHCVELGLNRREILFRNFPEVHDRERAALLFWSVYMLDRRSCLGMGVPYVLQDSEVDLEHPEQTTSTTPSFFAEIGSPEPAIVRSASRAYLAAMVDFTRLSGRAYKIMSKLNSGGATFPAEDIERLDYQVLQWYQNLSNELQLSRSTLRQAAEYDAGDPVRLFLAAVLTARFYQLRNVLFRPSLYSESRVSEFSAAAKNAVLAARESIMFLWTLNEVTHLLRAQVIFWKHFMISAISVLLLAMINAPRTFGCQAKEEFHKALDLFRIMSAESPLMAKYSKTITGLEQLAVKVGFSRMNDTENMQQQEPRTGRLDVDGRAVDFLNINNAPSANDDGLSTSLLDPADARNEFATFFNASTGYETSLFDLPLTDMFLNDAPLAEIRQNLPN